MTKKIRFIQNCRFRRAVLIGVIPLVIARLQNFASRGVQCVWGNATTMYLPQPPRGLCCQPVSEWEVTRWAETILVTDNSHFEGPKLLVIRWEGLMWWTIYWALWICWFCGVWGRTVAPGEDFVGMTLRSACKWRVKKPAFCIIYTEEQFAAFLL